MSTEAEPTRPDDDEPTIVLERWNEPIADGDKDANLKEDIAAHRLLDPLSTIEGLSASIDVPVGAIARYVLAKFATGGSEGMLHVGGTTVERMHQACEAAEATDTDEARLAAYEQLRQMVSWLRVPFENPDLYE